MKLAQRIIAVLAVLLSLQMANALAAAKYSAEDPDIAAAVYGMLTIMIEVGECTNGTIDQRGLNKFLKNAGLTAATVKKKCQECYESGLKGAVMIVKQKGPDAYCATMKQLYGPKGTQFPGLMK